MTTLKTLAKITAALIAIPTVGFLTICFGFNVNPFALLAQMI